MSAPREQEQQQGKTEKSASPNQPQEPVPSRDATRIVGGIEWFTIRRAEGAGLSPQFAEDEDCQCARCGSSCDFRDCGQCDDGEVEHAPWDGCGEPYYARCDWCKGRGGSYHCISSPEWCEANPLPDRAHITSTALRADAWND